MSHLIILCLPMPLADTLSDFECSGEAHFGQTFSYKIPRSGIFV